jgi:branched-chain amino acid transport system ATP-binding protein
MTLEITDVCVHYGHVQALFGVTITVAPRQTVVVLGPNGAGKTTLVESIIGAVSSTGQVRLDGKDLSRLPVQQRVRGGISYVPHQKGVFPNLTVRENIRTAARGSWPAVWDELTTAFPLLADKQSSLGGELSGGQQQIVSIARALASRPRYVLMDEPSIGLSPVAIQQVVVAIEHLGGMDVGVLIAEQNTSLGLRVADHCEVLVSGRQVFTGTPEELSKSETLGELYLGLKE